jgi:hypothetical protein
MENVVTCSILNVATTMLKISAKPGVLRSIIVILLLEPMHVMSCSVLVPVCATLVLVTWCVRFNSFEGKANPVQT